MPSLPRPPTIGRRHVLRMAMATPLVGLAPRLTAAAAAADGTPVGTGTAIDATDLAGVALSWLGAPAAVVAHVVGVGAPDDQPIEVRADHGHGPADPTGRSHGPAVLVPGARQYRVLPTGAAHDLRVHPLVAPVGPLQFADVSVAAPIPGLEIIERANWTSVGRRDTGDCVLRSSVFGLGCRADVGLRHGVVHHTVNVNTYSQADVPRLLRGIQVHHMVTRGWDDIAYNFVIDRFGRIWQAREGDLLEPIVGGHTLGFNAESVGVAVLGTFTSAAPPPEVVTSLSRLLGWKLSLHGVDPLGRTIVRASDPDFAEHGAMVEISNISGHRDLQQTSCPGSLLYAQLDRIRLDAAELVPVFGHLEPTYSLDDVTVEGWAIDRFNPADAVRVDIAVDGGEPTELFAGETTPGLGRQYPDAGDGHGFRHTVPIDLHTTSIAVTAHAADGTAASLMDLRLFATFIDVEPDRFFAPGVWFLREKGLTTGTLPGLFEPMDEVTRGQMATFLHRFMDSPVPGAPAPFDDVADDAFYADAVAWLAEAGITTGTAPDQFSPDRFVTRGQMATFLWRLCGQIPPAALPPFDDLVEGAFYVDAVAWLAETGITTGLTPTTFGPQATVTRGQMAVFLQRLATTPSAWTRVAPPSVVTA